MSNSPLHKVPLGLLELLRLKTLGRSPDQFGDTLVPSFDALEAYAAPELQTVSGPQQGPAAITTGQTSSSVISSFVWLWGISGALTLGAAAGTIVMGHVGVIVGPNNQECVLGAWDLRPTAAATTVRFGVALPRPLVLRAGSTVFARAFGDAGGADHVFSMQMVQVPAANLV